MHNIGLVLFRRSNAEILPIITLSKLNITKMLLKYYCSIMN